MIRASLTFPVGFLWGTATAAHQVEGGNDRNDFWAWEQQDGRIAEGHRSGVACDWWGGRWREDLDRAANAGQNVHRLSVEWSRIETAPGRFDTEALAAYRSLLEGVRQRGLLPIVSLHHFTNPLWFADLGGWLNPDAPARFEAFVRRTVAEFSDLVTDWVTINEPNVYVYAAYTVGVFPPGISDQRRAFEVLAHLLQAHARAYHAVHRESPQARVGVAHHYRGFRARHTWNPLERLSAWVRDQVFNESFPRALQDGRLRLPGRTVRFPEVAGTQDFFGLNYYTSETVAFDATRPGEFFGRSEYPDDGDVSPNGFLANAPDGFWKALVWARGFGLPIRVTENGVEDRDDLIRPRYLASHLRQLWRAVNLNWGVDAYLHWTLVDNFEWERGWTQRFGLWSLNLETQERSRRPSADFYEEVCRRNALTSEAVATFAPEVLEDLFPAQGVGRVAFGPMNNG